MVQLDKEYYNKDNAGIYDLCMSWYNKNPDIYTIALRGNTVVGYINFTPLTNRAYSLYKKGLIKDSELTEKDIEKFSPNKHNKCLFMSIVVKKSERYGATTKALLTHLLNHINALKQKGILITALLADCVNQDVEKYAKRKGMTKILETNRNSVIYEIKNDNGLFI